MVGLKLLLDTHIFIALEDPKIVPPATAMLAEKAQRHGISLFLDEAAIEDIQRDPNIERRTSTLSKLSKFPVHKSIAHTLEPDLVTRFGPMKKPNDRCDVLMLDTLDLGIVDFLVTEDTGIHKRAERAGLRRRVFTVREALAYIQRTYEPNEFRLPHIISRKAHEIAASDPIFDSIRGDYADFNDWFAKCRREQRDCWVIEEEGHLAGLVILKNEKHAQALTRSAGERILKVCTFKMAPEYQGEKFGEQLLKKILWYAQGNGFDAVYLTAYSKQEALINLLLAFGFEVTRTEADGQLVIEKPMHRIDTPVELGNLQPLARDMQVYPRFYEGPQIGKYVIPIQGAFHQILFPEIAEATPMPLFAEEQPFLIGASAASDRTPGNTIRKVYVCRSPTRTLGAGDLLFFYLSKCGELARSQSITTIGVVEQARLAPSTQDLIRMVGRRSVYSRESLEAWGATEDSPVLVIDFVLCGHFQPHVTLDELLKQKVFCGRPTMSIKRLTQEIYAAFRARAQLNYA